MRLFFAVIFGGWVLFVAPVVFAQQPGLTPDGTEASDVSESDAEPVTEPVEVDVSDEPAGLPEAAQVSEGAESSEAPSMDSKEEEGKQAESQVSGASEDAPKDTAKAEAAVGNNVEEAAQVVDTSGAEDSARPNVPPDLESGFSWPYDRAFITPTIPSGPPLNQDEERALVPLSHREPAPTTAGDVLVWIPRVLFFPVYLVTEYGVRWPLGVVTRAAEKYRIIDYVIEYTTWDDGNGQILPTLRFSSGFETAVGFNITWENMIYDTNDWGLNFDFAGTENFTFEIATRQWMFDDLLSLELALQLEFRNDFVFYGIGADTEDTDEVRFSREKVMGYAELELERLDSGIGGWARFEHSQNEFGCPGDHFLRTEDEDETEEASICGPDNRPDTGDEPGDVLAQIPYFSRGYDMARLKGSLFYDSRDERPANGSGMRLEVIGRYGEGLAESAEEIRFYHLGGLAGFFWDIWKQRTLSASAYLEVAEPIGDAAIPFAELITLGGVETMRGFDLARFHGRSAFVGALTYQYPVWSFLDGYVVAEAGNAFASGFEDFEVEKLHGSFAIGFTTIDTRYNSFDMLVAVGSRRFEQGFEFESLRIAIGTNWGL